MPPVYGPVGPSGGRALRRAPQPISTSQGPLSVQFLTRDLIRITERLTGRFRSQPFYDALRTANAQAAFQVQKGMYDELHRNIGKSANRYANRPQRGGDRLGKAIMSERNALVRPNNFTVGIADWLDKSPAALYWRRIEQGDARTFSAYVSFTNVADGGGYGQAAGPYSRPNEGGPHMRMPQFRGPHGSQPFVRNIGPFPALRYSQGGREAFARLDMADLYARHLTAAGFPITKETRGNILK